MRFQAADIQVVIRLWRLLVCIGPGEADAGRAAADACRLEHGNVCPGLSQPKATEAPITPAPITIIFVMGVSSTATGLWHATTAPSPDGVCSERTFWHCAAFWLKTWSASLQEAGALSSPDAALGAA